MKLYKKKYGRRGDVTGKKGNQNNRIFESNLKANGVMLGDAVANVCKIIKYLYNGRYV